MDDIIVSREETLSRAQRLLEEHGFSEEETRASFQRALEAGPLATVYGALVELAYPNDDTPGRGITLTEAIEGFLRSCLLEADLPLFAFASNYFIVVSWQTAHFLDWLNDVQPEVSSHSALAWVLERVLPGNLEMHAPVAMFGPTARAVFDRLPNPFRPLPEFRLSADDWPLFLGAAEQLCVLPRLPETAKAFLSAVLPREFAVELARQLLDRADLVAGQAGEAHVFEAANPVNEPIETWLQRRVNKHPPPTINDQIRERWRWEQYVPFQQEILSGWAGLTGQPYTRIARLLREQGLIKPRERRYAGEEENPAETEGNLDEQSARDENKQGGRTDPFTRKVRKLAREQGFPERDPGRLPKEK